MAPKKRPTSTSSAQQEPPMILVKEALDDLRYIEPVRASKRIVSALNELFIRVHKLEHMHQDSDEARH